MTQQMTQRMTQRGGLDRGLVERLRRLRDPRGAFLSVYLTVPTEAAGLRGLPTRLDGLLRAARATAVEHQHLDECDLLRPAERIRAAIASRRRDWLGHTVVLVAGTDTGSGDGGVFEAAPLPCQVDDRAFVGPRPHVRTVLAAFQRCRPYDLVVVDRTRAWLFEMDGETVRPVRALADPGVRDRSHGGWHGLDEYGARQRAEELIHRHYRLTVGALEALLDGDLDKPFVVAGHRVGAHEFVAPLPAALRARVAGMFVIDPHTMTPTELRRHGADVMARREAARARRLAVELAAAEAAGRATGDLVRCLDAVARSRAEVLVIRGDQAVPGYVCDGCGRLAVLTAVAGVWCPLCGVPARYVPDVLDEAVVRVLDDHGRVELFDAVPDGADVQVGVALRSPIPAK